MLSAKLIIRVTTSTAKLYLFSDIFTFTSKSIVITNSLSLQIKILSNLVSIFISILDFVLCYSILDFVLCY